MRLRLVAGTYRGSRPSLRDRWYAGEERDVTAEDAEYLLATFGAMFVVVEPPAPAVVAEVVEAPPVDRAIKPPRRGR